MKKFIIIGSGLLVALLVILWLIPTGSTKKGTMEKDSAGNNSVSGSDGKLFDEAKGGKELFYEEQASEIYKDDKFLTYEEVIEKASSGRLNLVWELWTLRKKCPADYTPAQCNSLVLALIEKNFPPPGGTHLVGIFKNYIEYENEARKIEMGSKEKALSFEERYELLRKKRRDIFKEEDVKLVFGYEEAKVNFIEASQKLLEKLKNKSGDEKVREYEKTKKQVYGGYYDAVKEKEEKFDDYQTELFLRDADLKKLNPQEREAKTKEIEVKIFGKETAERMAKGREEFAREEELIQSYKQKETEFLANNSSLPQKEKEERLKKIRVGSARRTGTAEFYDSRSIQSY